LLLLLFDCPSLIDGIDDDLLSLWDRRKVGEFNAIIGRELPIIITTPIVMMTKITKI
jgi:hypothetical protein